MAKQWVGDDRISKHLPFPTLCQREGRGTRNHLTETAAPHDILDRAVMASVPCSSYVARASHFLSIGWIR